MSAEPAMRWKRAPRDTSMQSLPQSLEAERAVLGGMLLLGGNAAGSDLAVLSDLVARIAPEMFYSSDHGRLYELLAMRVRDGEPMDVLGLADHLMLTQTATTVGGISYATSLPEHVPTVTNIDHYVDVMLDKYKRRKLLEHAAHIRQLVFEGDRVDVIADRVATDAERLRSLGVQASTDDVPIAEAAEDFYARLWQEKADQAEGRTTGIPFGFHAIDKLGCPQPGELLYFAGRPAMGKTQLMMQVLVNHATYIAARRLPGVVYICSLEMDRHQLLARLVSSISGVPYSVMLNPMAAMDVNTLTVVDEAKDRIKRLPIVINDRPARNMAGVQRSVRALVRQHGAVHTIGLDYIQLAAPEDAAAEMRSQQLTQTAYAALAIAREYRARFFCAVQLNRGVESRQDKRPSLSDLGESGGLEAAAQWVFMIYRDDYYNPQSAEPGTAEVLCRKARNGETNVGKLAFRRGVFHDRDVDSPTKYGNGGWY